MYLFHMLCQRIQQYNHTEKPLQSVNKFHHSDMGYYHKALKISSKLFFKVSKGSNLPVYAIYECKIFNNNW